MSRRSSAIQLDRARRERARRSRSTSSHNVGSVRDRVPRRPGSSVHAAAVRRDASAACWRVERRASRRWSPRGPRRPAPSMGRKIARDHAADRPDPLREHPGDVVGADVVLPVAERLLAQERPVPDDVLALGEAALEAVGRPTGEARVHRSPRARCRRRAGRRPGRAPRARRRGHAPRVPRRASRSSRSVRDPVEHGPIAAGSSDGAPARAVPSSMPTISSFPGSGVAPPASLKSRLTSSRTSRRSAASGGRRLTTTTSGSPRSPTRASTFHGTRSA